MALDRPSNEHTPPEAAVADSRQGVETVDRGTSEGASSNGEGEAADDITFDELQRLADEEESKFAERKSSEAKPDSRSQPSDSSPDPGRAKVDDTEDITFEELQALAAEEEAKYLALKADRAETEGPAEDATSPGGNARDLDPGVRRDPSDQRKVPSEHAEGRSSETTPVTQSQLSDSSPYPGRVKVEDADDLTFEELQALATEEEAKYVALRRNHSDAVLGGQVTDQGPNHQSGPGDNVTPSPLVGRSGDTAGLDSEDRLSYRGEAIANEETTSSTRDAVLRPVAETGSTDSTNLSLKVNNERPGSLASDEPFGSPDDAELLNPENVTHVPDPAHVRDSDEDSVARDGSRLKVHRPDGVDHDRGEISRIEKSGTGPSDTEGLNPTADAQINSGEDEALGGENRRNESSVQYPDDGSVAPTSLSADRDSKVDRSQPISADQLDIENASTIQIWAHQDLRRLDGAFARYLLQHRDPIKPVRTDTSAGSDSDANSEARDFEIPASEQLLRAKTVDSYSPLSLAANANDVFEANFDDGSKGVYKPAQGEAFGLRIDIPHGELWKREVAASRLDDLLGFDLVPMTTVWDGHQGVGSMQNWSEGSNPGRRPVNTYDDSEVERMAVFDYVIGNTDRHRNNYLTDPDGHIVAIDHGCAFPEGETDPIRSDFVAEKFRNPISSETLKAVRRVDLSVLNEVLRSAGLNDDAVSGAEARIKEIQENGAITGQSWPGMITDALWKSVR